MRACGDGADRVEAGVIPTEAGDDLEVSGPAHGARRRWIVDGNNVMGARPDGWWRDRRAAALRLTRQVAALETTPELDVVVVFDGAGPGGTEHSRELRTDVVYAGRATTADDTIVKMVREARGRPTRVFTSDAELGRRVRVAGAEVSGARSLLSMIETGVARE